MLGVMTTCVGYCAHSVLQEIVPSLKEIYVDVMLTNYKLWIPMQLLNFGAHCAQFGFRYQVMRRFILASQPITRFNTVLAACAYVSVNSNV